MRFAGLAIALLASSLGARAQSAEDRVAALEARVKALEAALQQRSSAPLALGVGARESATDAYEIAAPRVIQLTDGSSDTNH